MAEHNRKKTGRKALLAGTIILLLAAAAAAWVLLSGRQTEEAAPAPKPRVASAFSEDWIAAGRGTVAHAFGGIDGRAYTNSAEAFGANYRAGCRVFESDLNLMDDGSVILCHDEDYWRAFSDAAEDAPYDRESFLGSVLYDSYTTLDIMDLVRIMRDHPDIYIVVDSKYPSLDGVKFEYRQLVTWALLSGPGIAERIIPQAYTEDMYWALMDIYPFRSMIYTLYMIEWTPEEVYAFCERSGVRFVTVDYRLLTPEIAELWKTIGIRIGVHTVNDRELADRCFAKGADMIYTDFLGPEE